MAFDYFEEQDEENESGAAGPQKSLGQESSVISGERQENEGDKTSSGTFTNLNSYLDANKSLQFGQQVAGKVQGQVDEATRTQDETEGSFRSQVNAGAVDKNEDLLGRVSTGARDVVKNQADVEEFAKQ